MSYLLVGVPVLGLHLWQSHGGTQASLVEANSGGLAIMLGTRMPPPSIDGLMAMFGSTSAKGKLEIALFWIIVSSG
ncbi:MAG: hypothetical protein EOM16_08445 [Bacteroidia bacterium]|nr:hypothetical protein [Bacteroidia bacterium]